MQQQNRPKLIVSLSEAISQDPNNQLQEQVADIINSLQNRILAVPEKTSDYDLKVVLLDGDAKRPYYRPKPIARSDPDADHRFEIDIAFYEKRGIKLQLEYYVCYLFSVTVLQYLYREVVGSEYQIFQTLDYPNISYLAWNGLIPSHATQTFENFSSSAEPTGLKLHIDAVLNNP